MNRQDDKAKISVVTVTRNAGPLLLKTINSVASQTYDNLEYIVIDGASSDNSPQIIAQSGCISRYISERDNGIYDAMNKGVQLASGEWILFMNAGDTFAGNDTLGKLAEEAISHPDAEVIYGDVIRCGENGDEIKVASDSLKGHRLAFCHQSVMCKREDLLLTPFDISHRYSADFKFFKTLQNAGRKFHHARFPVARFDTSGISTVNRSNGLADNMRVILEVDRIKGLSSLLHLLPTYLISKLRGK